MLARAFRAITQLDRVGTESVDGVDTTHYVVTVDTMKALRLLGLEDLAGVNIDDLRTSLPKTFDYDAWLDDSGRPVRLKARYAGACIDVHLSQWGEPVSVSAPPASQVSQFSF